MTTREKCQAQIKGVCSGCGGALEPIETVDNARNPTFWAGCLKCSQFDDGVDAKVFDAARKLVEREWLRPYSHVKNGDPMWMESQTRGAVRIVYDVLRVAKETGLLPTGHTERSDG